MTECERIIQSGRIGRDFLKEETRCDFFVDLERKKLWMISLDLLMEFEKKMLPDAGFVRIKYYKAVK